MRTVTDETPKKPRREAVWDVCDQLSAQGVKPSLRNVKMHYPRGSDTDVQKDVNAWYEHVFAQHARRRVVPSLPDAVVQAMEAFWETASTQANAQFSGEREAHASNTAQLQSELETARGELAQTKERLVQSDQDKEDLRLTLSNSNSRLDEASRQIDALRLDLEEARRQAHKNEQDLLDEIRQMKAAHERNLQTQREDFELQVRLVREAGAQQSTEHQRVLERAEEHYRDLERRSLMEVDAARTKLKAAEDGLEKFRSLAHNRDIEIANLRTELRLVREASALQIEDFTRRNAELMAEIQGLRRGP